MKYIRVPAPVQVRYRNGELLRADFVGPSGQIQQGPPMDPISFFDYAEAWWNSERLNKGGFKARKMTEKIIAAFDDAKQKGLGYVVLEDAEYDHLLPSIDETTFFKTAPLELQVQAFPTAVNEATSRLPADLNPDTPQEVSLSP